MNAPRTAENPSRSIDQMFSDIADRYDLLNHLLSFGLDLHWRHKAFSRIHAPTPVVILDVCCGTGDSLKVIRSRHARLVGVDLSRPMLLRCRQKLVHTGTLGPLVLVEADAHELPLPDASIDALTIAFGIRNLTDLERALREFHRVLRPLGTLHVLEFTLPRNRVAKRLARFYLERILPRVGGWISGDRAAYHYLARTIQAFPQFEAFCQIVASFGFQCTEMETFFPGVATAYHFRKRPAPADS